MSEEIKEMLKETFDNQEYVDQLGLAPKTACGCSGCACASK